MNTTLRCTFNVTVNNDKIHFGEMLKYLFFECSPDNGFTRWVYQIQNMKNSSVHSRYYVITHYDNIPLPAVCVWARPGLSIGRLIWPALSQLWHFFTDKCQEHVIVAWTYVARTQISFSLAHNWTSAAYAQGIKGHASNFVQEQNKSRC